MRNVVLRIAAVSALSASSILYTSQSAAAQASEGYRYEQTVTVENKVAKAFTDIQVAFALNTRTLIQEGKLSSGANDIRVITSDGRVLKHAVEGAIPSSYTRIWVRVPELPASGSITLRVLTGHEGAESNVDPDAVFELWDGFDGDTPSGIFDKNCGTASLTQADGKGTFSWTNSGFYVAVQGGPGNAGRFPTTDGYMVDAEITAFTGTNRALAWVNQDNESYALSGNSNTIGITYSAKDASNLCTTHSFVTTNSTSQLPSTVGTFSFAWTSAGQTARLVGASNFAAGAHHMPGAELRLGIGGYATGTGSLTLDWVRVRKFAGTDPSATVGAAVERALEAPSITGITAGLDQLEVAFEYAPTDNATEIATAYTVTCGATSVEGEGSPLVVTGLPQNTLHECTVSVGNSLGETLVSEVVAARTLGNGNPEQPGDGDGDGDDNGSGDGDGSTGGDGDGDDTTGGDGDDVTGGDGDDDDDTSAPSDAEPQKKSSGGCSVPDHGASLSSALLMGLALLFSRRRKAKQTA